MPDAPIVAPAGWLWVRYTGALVVSVEQVGEWVPDDVRCLPPGLAGRLVTRDDFELDAPESPPAAAPAAVEPAVTETPMPRSTRKTRTT
jgi:hypothetical protein